MPGRNANPGSYRYGFGSHEKDDEIKGEVWWKRFAKKEPKYDKALYNANKKSDRDKDGIACEK